MGKPHNLPISSLQYMGLIGAGVKDSHAIITNSTPFVGSKTKFVYAIETGDKGATFDVLKEEYKSVDAARRDYAGAGYPERSIIPGRFTHITPGSGVTVAVYIIEIA